MRTICVIGMGPGAPEYLTLQAVEAIKSVDVFLLLGKEGAGKEALSEARRRILDAHRDPASYRVVTAPSPPRRPAGEDYLDVVADWHSRKAEGLAAFIAEHVAEGETAGLLVWGDPSLYDSSVALLRRLRDERGLDIELKVVPGVSSVQALAARHEIALHEIGGEVVVTPARRLGAAVAAGHDSIAVMLDSNAAFSQIDPAGYDIYWGAYLGTEREILRAGKLAEIGPEIAEIVRREKERNGWIFDIYLLRRRGAA